MEIIHREKGKWFPTSAELRRAGFAVSEAVAGPAQDDTDKQADSANEIPALACPPPKPKKEAAAP